MRNLYLVFIFALALSCFYIVNDGALGAPCENDSGAAYGLCTAYCTMGCTGQVSDPEGCDKVLEKYMQFTNEDVSCCQANSDCKTNNCCVPKGRCYPTGTECLTPK